MRVLVTGIGIVSPLARGADPTMERLLAGESAIRPLTLFELPELRANLSARVPDIDAETVRVAAGGHGPWSRADAMAVLAGQEAMQGAGLRTATGVELFLGGSTGGNFECEESLAALKRDITADVDRTVLAAHPLSAASDRMHEVMGPFTHVTPVCSACSGGSSAILLAANAIRHQRTEIALAGGVDALCRLTYAGFSALNALDAAACRPFDANRAGLNLGEGAAFLVLESEVSARARGRQALAELAGWAVASEAHHITHPEPSGETASRVMQQALADAGLTPADVDYVNAHGTATPHNDPMETAAITGCFGERTPEVWVSSIKGSIGHTLAAAGAIEAAVTAMVVSRGVIPPTVGLVEADAACTLRHVFAPQRVPVRVALSNAFGFGGTDTALVFRQVGQGRDVSVSEDQPAPCRVAITGAACFGPLGLLGGADLAAARAYAEPGPTPPDAQCAPPAETLDSMRGRRLDRASKLVTLTIQRALGEVSDARTGVVVGTAHGGVTATTQVVCRVFENGARFVSPAQFPCVLPSAMASHPSIYLGLEGPALACSDLSTSAEAALVIAVDLVRDGGAPRMVAAAVDEFNVVAAKVSAVITCGIPDRGARTEGASALTIERLELAAGRVLAEIAWHKSWRGPDPELPAPGDNAAVYVARAGAVPTGWSTRPCHVIADRAGDHESVGGATLVVAVAALVAGDCDEALVLGRGPDRGYAFLLRASRP